jgi:hypothetical protein
MTHRCLKFQRLLKKCFLLAPNRQTLWSSIYGQAWAKAYLYHIRPFGLSDAILATPYSPYLVHSTLFTNPFSIHPHTIH